MAVVGNVIISDAVPLKSRGLYQGCACNSSRVLNEWGYLDTYH